MPSGLKFPLTISNGRFEVTEGSVKFTQNISRIINTYLGEREMEPDMGSDSFTILFRTNNSSILNTVLIRLKDAINRQEPRISIKDINAINNNNGQLFINVFYTINGSEELIHDQIEVNN